MSSVARSYLLDVPRMMCPTVLPKPQLNLGAGHPLQLRVVIK
jgi:hypothetical protein